MQFKCMLFPDRLSVPKFTANLYCICLSSDLRKILRHSVDPVLAVSICSLSTFRKMLLKNANIYICIYILIFIFSVRII